MSQTPVPIDPSLPWSYPPDEILELGLHVSLQVFRTTKLTRRSVEVEQNGFHIQYRQRRVGHGGGQRESSSLIWKYVAYNRLQ